MKTTLAHIGDELETGAAHGLCGPPTPFCLGTWAPRACGPHRWRRSLHRRGCAVVVDVRENLEWKLGRTPGALLDGCFTKPIASEHLTYLLVEKEIELVTDWLVVKFMRERYLTTGNAPSI